MVGYPRYFGFEEWNIELLVVVYSIHNFSRVLLVSWGVLIAKL